MIPLIDTGQLVEVVCSKDAAVDQDKSDFEEYRKTLDMRHIALRDGQKATLFVIAPLSPARAAAITVEALGGETGVIGAGLDLSLRQFREGIRGFKHLEDAAGRLVDYVAADSKKGKGLLEMIPHGMASEIGGYVGRLGEGLPKSEVKLGEDLGK